MKKLSYRNQVLIFAAWIVVVIVLFKTIDDRQVAALIAGSGFILLPLWVLALEISGSRNRIHIFAILFFLLTSAVPVFLLRILNWGVNFNDLEILGVPAVVFHRLSNFTYMAMLISALFLYRQERSQSK